MMYRSMPLQFSLWFQLTLLVLLVGVVAADLFVEWDKFKQQYNKQYATAAEETERKQIFLENLEEMLAFQKTHSSATFTTGINHLFDRRMEVLLADVGK